MLSAETILKQLKQTFKAGNVQKFQFETFKLFHIPRSNFRRFLKRSKPN